MREWFCVLVKKEPKQPDSSGQLSSQILQTINHCRDKVNLKDWLEGPEWINVTNAFTNLQENSSL